MEARFSFELLAGDAAALAVGELDGVADEVKYSPIHELGPIAPSVARIAPCRERCPETAQVKLLPGITNANPSCPSRSKSRTWPMEKGL